MSETKPAALPPARQVFLLTTAMLADGQEPPVLDRLLASIEAQSHDGVDVTFLILFQNCAGASHRIAERYPSIGKVVELSSPTPLSLSAARNRLIGWLRQNIEVSDASVVAFPDDDAWYPSGLLAGLSTLFDQDPDVGMVFCRYGTTAAPMSPSVTAEPASAFDVVINASSNTIFVLGNMFKGIGLFDENLGVGTPNKSSEDIDYALRAFLSADRTIFIDRILVGHRDKSGEHRAKYYKGALIVARRYALRSPMLFWLFLRKLLVGIAFVGLGKLRPGELVASVRAMRSAA